MRILLHPQLRLWKAIDSYTAPAAPWDSLITVNLVVPMAEEMNFLIGLL